MPLLQGTSDESQHGVRGQAALLEVKRGASVALARGIGSSQYLKARRAGKRETEPLAHPSVAVVFLDDNDAPTSLHALQQRYIGLEVPRKTSDTENIGLVPRKLA